MIYPDNLIMFDRSKKFIALLFAVFLAIQNRCVDQFLRSIVSFFISRLVNFSFLFVIEGNDLSAMWHYQTVHWSNGDVVVSFSQNNVLSGGTAISQRPPNVVILTMLLTS